VGQKSRPFFSREKVLQKEAIPMPMKKKAAKKAAKKKKK
jgi:hypothetical protein